MLPVDQAPRGSREAGNASPVMVGGVAIVMVLMIGLTDLSVYYLARTRAQTAADAAALAAAAELIPGLGTAPEARAQEFAQANGAELRSCECALGSRAAEITVGVPVRMSLSSLSGLSEVTARARAEVNLPFGG